MLIIMPPNDSALVEDAEYEFGTLPAIFSMMVLFVAIVPPYDMLSSDFPPSLARFNDRAVVTLRISVWCRSCAYSGYKEE